MIGNSEHEKAHQFYLAGERTKDIAKKLGIPRSRIDKWVERGKWNDHRKELVAATSTAVATTVVEIKQRIATEHVERAHRIVTGDMKFLEGSTPTSAKEAEQRARALKTLDDVGRRNLGLDQQESQGPRVRVGINLHLGSYEPRRLAAAEIAQREVPGIVEVENLP